MNYAVELLKAVLKVLSYEYASIDFESLEDKLTYHVTLNTRSDEFNSRSVYVSISKIVVCDKKNYVLLTQQLFERVLTFKEFVKYMSSIENRLNAHLEDIEYERKRVSNAL